MARINGAGYGPLNVTAFSGEDKATPVVADKLIIIDSEDGNRLKQIEIDNLPGGGGTGWAGEVNAYADLPAATGSGDVYLVKTSTGFLWAQRKGLYQDNGTWARLSNATFEVLDSEATFSDDGDNTKKLQFQLNQISSGNTRTIIMRDTNLDLANVVEGPSSAVNNRIATFDGTSGKLVKDPGTGYNISDLASARDHVTADGSSHSFINQSVTTAASPTFAGLTVNSSILVTQAGTTGFTITDTTNGTALLNAGSEFDMKWTKTTGNAIMDFEAKASDGTSTCEYRFGISSGSTGDNRIVLFMPNSTTRQTQFQTTGTSYICGQNGRLAVGGTSSLSSGDLSVHGTIVNQPRSSVTLSNNGDFEIEATSNTSLTFRYRGSDGTTRSANLTLS